MSRGGTGRGRSVHPASLPPQLHFDRLMTAVGQAAESSSRHAESPRSGPASGWQEAGGQPYAAKASAYASAPSSGRANPLVGAGGGGTPREIMAAAVQQLPSLVDTLQAGSWLTSQEAAGLRVPSAPTGQRPARAPSGQLSARPVSARPVIRAEQQHVGGTRARPNSAREATSTRAGSLLENAQDPPLAAANRAVPNSASEMRVVEISRGQSAPEGTASISKDWAALSSSESFLTIVQRLCSLGKSSKTDSAIEQTRAVVREGLGCEGCSVFLVMGENRLVRNKLSAAELPETFGVVGRVVQRMDDTINVSREDTCDFFDQRVDRDPDLKLRMGQGLLAQGVVSSSGELLAVILAVGKLQGPCFGHSDEIILKAIAAQLAMILGLCKTVRKMENTFKEGERDIRFAKALNECRTSDSVITLAKQYFKEITGATTVRFFDADLFAASERNDGLLDPDKEEPVETAARAFKSGHVFLIEDMSVNDQYSRMRKEHKNAKSVMSFPMRVGANGKILGIIQGMHRDAFTFSRHQAELMEPMLFMMTKVLERSQMSDNTLKLQTKLPKVFTTREVRDAILFAEGVAREVLCSKAACVFVLNKTDNKIWTVHPTSSSRDEFEAGIGLVGDCLNRNELIQVPNALKDARYFEPIDGTKCMDLGINYRHMMLAPIRALHDNSIIGVLVVSRDQNQSFSHTDQNFAQVIAITLSAAFEVCMENEIHEVALKDNRSMIRLAANIHHKLQTQDLVHAIILGTLQTMHGSECFVLLKHDVDMDKAQESKNVSTMKLRKFSLLGGKLEHDVVEWDDAVVEQTITKGLMVNVTSQRMLNAMGYKRLHRLSAISGNKALNSQIDRDPDELLLGPIMCCPLFTGLDRGQVFGAILIKRLNKAPVFTESEEQKLRYFCQHASSALRRTFEREKLVATIKQHEDNLARHVALVDFLNKMNDSADLRDMSRYIVRASKALGQCAGANFYTVETDKKRASDFSSGAHFVTRVRMGTEIHDKKLGIDKGIPGEVRRRGMSVLVNHPTSSPFFDHLVDEPRDGGACRNALGIPIYSKSDPSEVIAVLVLFNALDKTDNGWRNRDFEYEDVFRFQFFSLWIAIFLNKSLEVQVPVGAIEKILQKQSRTAEPVISGSEDFEALHHTVHLDLQSQEVAAWHAVSEAVKTATHCQAFAAFRLVSAERQELECLYPAQMAGHRLSANAGILKEALDKHGIVNIHDSKEDLRVSVEHDHMDFLNMRWDTGEQEIMSPNVLRYGDGKLSLRHARGPQILGQEVQWLNAVVVPMLHAETGITGLVLALNKPSAKGVFHIDEINLIQTLVTLKTVQDTSNDVKLSLAQEVGKRRTLIKDAGDIILKGSQTLTSTAMYAQNAVANMLKMTKASYGAIYMINSRSEGVCTKYDSQGLTAKEKRNKSLPWTVMDTRSPIAIPHATDLEASQTVPARLLGQSRSIMALPLVLENEVQGALLVACKSDGGSFDEHDEHALQDFAVLFGSTQKLLKSVEELVNAVELEMAIPSNSLPPRAPMSPIEKSSVTASPNTSSRRN